MHPFKAHRGVVGVQGLRTWCVSNLTLTLHQREHLVQVGQALFDFAVNHTQEIERNVQLNHESIDHDQVAQRHAAIHDTLCCAPQHGDQTDGDDELLTCIEQAQRGLRLQPSLAQSLQAFVVALGLIGFVVEILDGFVVQ